MEKGYIIMVSVDNNTEFSFYEKMSRHGLLYNKSLFSFLINNYLLLVAGKKCNKTALSVLKQGTVERRWIEGRRIGIRITESLNRQLVCECIGKGFRKTDVIRYFIKCIISASDGLLNRIHGIIDRQKAKNRAFDMDKKHISIKTQISSKDIETLEESAAKCGVGICLFLKQLVYTFLDVTCQQSKDAVLNEAFSGAINQRGYNRYYLKERKDITVYINEENRIKQIYRVMAKHGIYSLSDFLKRVLKNFLGLINKGESYSFSLSKNDTESDENGFYDENEMYWNDRLSRNDFMYSIYK